MYTTWMYVYAHTCVTRIAKDGRIIPVIHFPLARLPRSGPLDALKQSRLGEHKPGRIKPGRIKRAALSLQHQNCYTFDVCRVKYPGTKQLPIHISGAGFEANLQIWLLGTTPFDTTPFIRLRVKAKSSAQWLGLIVSAPRDIFRFVLLEALPDMMCELRVARACHEKHRSQYPPMCISVMIVSISMMLIIIISIMTIIIIRMFIIIVCSSVMISISMAPISSRVIPVSKDLEWLDIHPIRIRRFCFVRTQPLEHLGRS